VSKLPEHVLGQAFGYQQTRPIAFDDPVMADFQAAGNRVKLSGHADVARSVDLVS